MKLRKPFALPPSPLVAVIAPSGDSRPERLTQGTAAAEAFGWRLRFEPSARGRHGLYFSGTPGQRAADLHSAFADPEVDAILCTRGGYGANYLLPLLDLDLVAANPKPLLGYSDTTALQTWLLDQVGLVTLHAPMLSADFYLPEGVDHPSLAAILAGETYTYAAEEGLRVLRPGVAEGELHGGCLTLLAASLGTPYAPRLTNTLLFLEDVAEPPYKLDRLLRQLRLAGCFEGVQGFVFGEMLNCAPAGDITQVEAAILHALDGLPGPIAIGLRSGHVSRRNLTLPLGVRATLVAADTGSTLTLEEPALQPRHGMRS